MGLGLRVGGGGGGWGGAPKDHVLLEVASLGSRLDSDPCLFSDLGWTVPRKSFLPFVSDSAKRSVL